MDRMVYILKDIQVILIMLIVNVNNIVNKLRLQLRSLILIN